MPGGPISVSYSYDDGGNCVSEGVERKYEWDHAGRLRSFRNQATDATEPTQYVQYLYDASGQRVKKLNRKQLGSDWDVVVYIDGVLEQRTQQRGATTKQGAVLHVLDGGKRLGMRRTGETFDAKPEHLLLLSDHLGSGSVELDWSLGDFLDREEFRPYGETSFGSYAHKRYRFTGKERDEESGLNYHGARYYAPGLARWMSPDPKGLVDGVNVYGYVRGNPVGLSDPTGTEAENQRQTPQTVLPNSDSTEQRGRENFDILARGSVSERTAPKHIVLPQVLIDGTESAWRGSFYREQGRILTREQPGVLSRLTGAPGYHYERNDPENAVDLISKLPMQSKHVVHLNSVLTMHTHPGSPTNNTAHSPNDILTLLQYRSMGTTQPTMVNMSLVRGGGGRYVLLVRTCEAEKPEARSVTDMYMKRFQKIYDREKNRYPLIDKADFFHFVPLSGVDVNMTDRSGHDSSGVISHHNARAFASKSALKEVAKSFHLITYEGDKNGLRRTN